MAERASHVRVSMLHQWQYELDHGADVTASVTVLAREGSREGVGEGSREGVGAPSGAPAVDASRRASGSRPRYVQHTILSWICLLYTSPSPRDRQKSRMPSSA